VLGLTNIVSAIRTDNAGGFVFEGVPAATYDLSFKAQGFVRRSITVKASESVVVVPPIVLQISSYTPYIVPLSIEETREREARVHREGTLEVRENCMISLDAGSAVCPTRNNGAPPNAPAKPDDIRIERDNDRLYFVPTSGAAIGKGNSSLSGPYKCSSANYANSRIRIDDLPEGSPICLQTHEGRRAELWLWFKESVCAEGDIWVSFVTWNR